MTKTSTTPTWEQLSPELGLPWKLQFDRDGTEDFGIICDAEGNDLVASHIPNRFPPKWADRGFGEGCFWLPEEEGDPIPLLVRQMQLMTAAPKLLEALEAAAQRLEFAISEMPVGEQRDNCEAEIRIARNVLLEATGNPVERAA